MAKNNFLLTTSWDDGAKEDSKLIKLLQKYNIPATFYINDTSAIKGKIPKEFEIGGHTKKHSDLTKIRQDKIKKSIAKPKSQDSFAYPYGKYNQHVKQSVGFTDYKFARTTALFETHIGDILTSGTTVHAYDHKLLLYIKEGFNKFLFYKLLVRGTNFTNWEDIAKKSLEITLNNGGIYHLWGHSWEIEKRNHWKKLENVFAYIDKRVDFKYRVKNGDIPRLFETRKSNYYEHYNYTNNNKKDENMVKVLSVKFNKKTNKILDLGCGDGRFARYFDKANYLGIDYKLPPILNKDKRFRKYNIKKINNLSLPKQDLVIAWGLFEDEVNPKISIPFRKAIYTLHNAGNFNFKIKEYIRRQLGLRPFAYTSFTKDFLNRNVSKDVIDFGEYLVVSLSNGNRKGKNSF